MTDLATRPTLDDLTGPDDLVTVALQPGDAGEHLRHLAELIPGNAITFHDVQGTFTHWTVDGEPWAWRNAQPITLAVPGRITIHLEP